MVFSGQTGMGWGGQTETKKGGQTELGLGGQTETELEVKQTVFSNIIRFLVKKILHFCRQELIIGK